MVDWDNGKEQIFWIKFLIAVVSAVIFFFLMQAFPTQIVMNPLIFYFSIMFLGCLFITFVLPPIVIVIFNRLRKSKRPPILQVLFYRVETIILVYTTIFTLLFMLNMG